MPKTRQSASLGPVSNYARRTPFDARPDEANEPDMLSLERRIVNLESAVNAVLQKLNDVSSQLDALIPAKTERIPGAADSEATVKETICQLLAEGEKRRIELIHAIYGEAATAQNTKYVGLKLRQLCAAGKIVRVRTGIYALAPQQ